MDDDGYDAHFLTPPSNNYICGICTFVVKNAVQISLCGHRLCSKCFEKWKISRRSGELFCPSDRRVINPNQVIPDPKADEEVLSLIVKCDYCTKGCQWYGELRNQKEHVGDCLYQMIDVLPALQTRLQLVEKTQTDHDITSDRLQKQLKSQLESLDARLKNGTKRFDKDIKEAKAAIQNYNKAINSLKSEIGQVKFISESIQILPDLEKRLRTMENTKTDQAMTSDKLLNQLKSQLGSLDAKLKNEMKRFDKDSRETKAAVQGISSLKSEMGHAKSALEVLPGIEKRVGDIENIQVGHNNSSDKLQNQLKSQLESLDARLNSAIKRFEEDVKEVKGSIQNYSKSVNSLKSEIGQVKSMSTVVPTNEVGISDKLLNQLKMQLGSLDTKLKNEIKRLDKDSKETKAAVEGMSSLKSEMGYAKSSLEVLPTLEKRLKFIEKAQTGRTIPSDELQNQLKSQLKSLDSRLENETKRLDKGIKETAAYILNHNLSINSLRTEIGEAISFSQALKHLQKRVTVIEETQRNQTKSLDVLLDKVNDCKADLLFVGNTMKYIDSKVEDMLQSEDSEVKPQSQDSGGMKCLKAVGKCVLGFAIGSVISVIVDQKKPNPTWFNKKDIFQEALSHPWMNFGISVGVSSFVNSFDLPLAVGIFSGLSYCNSM